VFHTFTTPALGLRDSLSYILR